MGIKLLNIKAKNFMSFEDLDVDLRKGGLYVITGQNDKGGDSNGAGKSTIFSAICYAMFGRTPKGVSGENCVSWGAPRGSMQTELVLLDGDKLIRIRRSLDILALEVNDETFPGSKLEIQKQINTLLKTDYFLFINSVCFSQGEGEFLCNATDTSKKKLLKAISGLESIDKMYDLCHKKYQSSTTQAVGLEARISKSKDYAAALEARILGLEQQEVGFEDAKRQRLIELEIELANICTDNSSSEEEGRISEAIKQLKLGLSNFPTDSDGALSTWAAKRTEAEVRLRDLETTVSKVDSLGSNCDVCGSVLSRKDLAGRKRSLQDTRQKLLQERADADIHVAQLEQDLAAREAHTSRIQDLTQRLNILRAQADAVLRGNELLKQRLERQLEEERSSVNPYSNMVREATASLSGLHGDLQADTAVFEATKKAIDSYGFLKWALGREGVPSFIIEQLFGRLEQLTNYYLGSLSTEKFEVRIKPQREKKDGGVKEEIDVRIVTDEREIPYNNLSDGQRQRVNLAVLIATFKVCQDLGMNRFDFLLLDEVLDLSLDQKGQQDVIEFMRSLLMEDVHAIYVISHKSDVSSDFEYEISVSRSADGLSHIVSGPYA